MRIAPKGKIQVFQRFDKREIRGSKKINKKLRSLHHASVISLGKIKYPKDYISYLVHRQKKLFFGIRTVILSNAVLKINLTNLNYNTCIHIIEQFTYLTIV